MSTFDIATLAAADTFDIPILYQGEPLIGDGGKPVTVTVYGPGTKQSAMGKALENSRMLKSVRQKGADEVDPDEETASIAEVLTVITKSFNGFSYRDGPNSEETFKALYLDRTMGWLTLQVNTKAGDWGNFTPKRSSKTSARSPKSTST